MRKLLFTATLLLSTAAFAGEKGAWAGWIGDSHCAAKGAGPAHTACAKKCIEGGAKPVLVTDSDKKVLSIANPDAVKGHEGSHVKVKGSIGDDGAVHIDSVEAM